ncbi:methyl-viologen-reducing hydrogenase subunit delta, partial [Methanosarcinales archaeon]
MKKMYEPRIVGFLCNWCCYAGADLAGVSRFQYPPSIRIIRVMCSGRVDPVIILDAFLYGADGVFVGGCHPGDCHYLQGNYYAEKKIEMAKRLLKEAGVSPEAVKAELKKTFSEKDAARLALSFKIVQEIDRLCNTGAKTEEYLDRLSVLRNYTKGFSDKFTTQVEEFARFMKQEQLEYLDEEY